MPRFTRIFSQLENREQDRDQSNSDTREADNL